MCVVETSLCPMVGFGIIDDNVLGFKTMCIDTYVYYLHTHFCVKLRVLFVYNTNPCLRELLSEFHDLAPF